MNLETTQKLTHERTAPFVIEYVIKKYEFTAPFTITGYTYVDTHVVELTLTAGDGAFGRGEAFGVYYRGETALSIVDQLERVRAQVEPGISQSELHAMLPAGGARNALDSALWDLRAKLGGRPVWELAGVPEPKPLRTTITCGADEPSVMADRAMAFPQARALKLKLTGDPIDRARVEAVRAARPDVWLGVDANQGFTRAILDELMPALVRADVELIEQPFAAADWHLLQGLRSPIPIAIDEGVQTSEDLGRYVGLAEVINIKLDKSGGLSEALKMARLARTLGFEPMVGCMQGSSLCLAPAFLVGQLCSIVDLDAPTFLRTDVDPGATYDEGLVSLPQALWGHPLAGEALS